jgi:hypothetical protein
MARESKALISLTFPLSVEDDWPPVSTESLPFTETDDGFLAQVAPLFVKDLSVGDLLNVTLGPNNIVQSWTHNQRSSRSTIWLLRLKEGPEIIQILQKLRDLDCNTVTMDTLGCYSIDVPETIAISDVDVVLDTLDKDAVAIAFPSMRHPE